MGIKVNVVKMSTNWLMGKYVLRMTEPLETCRNMEDSSTFGKHPYPVFNNESICNWDGAELEQFKASKFDSSKMEWKKSKYARNLHCITAPDVPTSLDRLQDDNEIK